MPSSDVGLLSTSLDSCSSVFTATAGGKSAPPPINFFTSQGYLKESLSADSMDLCHILLDKDLQINFLTSTSSNSKARTSMTTSNATNLEPVVSFANVMSVSTASQIISVSPPEESSSGIGVAVHSTNSVTSSACISPNSIAEPFESILHIDDVSDISNLTDVDTGNNHSEVQNELAVTDLTEDLNDDLTLDLSDIGFDVVYNDAQLLNDAADETADIILTTGEDGDDNKFNYFDQTEQVEDCLLDILDNITGPTRSSDIFGHLLTACERSSDDDDTEDLEDSCSLPAELPSAELDEPSTNNMTLEIKVATQTSPGGSTMACSEDFEVALLSATSEPRPLPWEALPERERRRRHSAPKHRVSFADEAGQALEEIRLIPNRSYTSPRMMASKKFNPHYHYQNHYQTTPQQSSDSWLNYLLHGLNNLHLSQNSHQSGAASNTDSNSAFIIQDEVTVNPMFDFPEISEDFHDRLFTQNVVLNNVTYGNDHNCLTGYVSVRNLAFQKSLTVRYTLDDWANVYDIYSEYVHGDVDSDVFRFAIYLPYRFSGNLVFAIKYHVDEEVYWDNNNGQNYVISVENSNSFK